MNKKIQTEKKKTRCLLCGDRGSRFTYPIAREIHLIQKHEYNIHTEEKLVEELVEQAFI